MSLFPTESKLPQIKCYTAIFILGSRHWWDPAGPQGGTSHAAELMHDSILVTLATGFKAHWALSGCHRKWYLVLSTTYRESSVQFMSLSEVSPLSSPKLSVINFQLCSFSGQDHLAKLPNHQSLYMRPKRSTLLAMCQSHKKRMTTGLGRWLSLQSAYCISTRTWAHIKARHSCVCLLLQCWRSRDRCIPRVHKPAHITIGEFQNSWDTDTIKKVDDEWGRYLILTFVPSTYTHTSLHKEMRNAMEKQSMIGILALERWFRSLRSPLLLAK